jgi:hypothetical protein
MPHAGLSAQAMTAFVRTVVVIPETAAVTQREPVSPENLQPRGAID